MAYIEAGENVVLDIENDGARQVKRAFPEAVMVFLLPPSMEELERRLRSRGDTDSSAVERRLAVAARQIADARTNFDHLVENGDLGAAVARLAGILTS